MINHNLNNPFLQEDDFFKSTQLNDNGLLLKAEVKEDLENIKKQLIALLKKQLQKSYEIDLNEELLIKGKSYPVGTIREWGGKKYKKIRQGKWMRVYSGDESRGEKLAITATIKKIQNAKSIKELAQIVRDNRKRFLNAEGKVAPVVEKLLDIAKEKRGEKPDQKELNEKEKEDNQKLLTLNRFKEINSLIYSNNNIEGLRGPSTKNFESFHIHNKKTGIGLNFHFNKIKNEMDITKVNSNLPERESHKIILSTKEFNKNQIQKIIEENIQSQPSSDLQKQFPKELDRFINIIKDSKNFEESFSKAKQIKGGEEVAKAAKEFSRLYPTSIYSTPKEAFQKFYDDVKRTKNEKDSLKKENSEIPIPEGYNPKVWEYSLSEAKKNKLWAENKKKELKGKEWTEASEISKKMLKEYLEKPIEQLAKEHYDYFKMRSHAYGKDSGYPIAPDWNKKWEELTGESPKNKN